MLANPIDRINTQVGTYFIYQIPEDTFYDVEDGNTRNLSLSLNTIEGDNITQDSFLQLDTSQQTLYGLPLSRHVTEDPALFYLTATDSGGLSVRDVFEIRINPEVIEDISYRFYSRFSLDYSNFISSTENIINMVSRLSEYFGDGVQSGLISVTEIRNGSVDLFWTNQTIRKDFCDNDTILELYAFLATEQGSVKIINPAYRQAMLPEFPVSDVNMEWLGACLVEPVTTEPTSLPVTDDDEFPLWLAILLPLLILLLIILVIVLICCILRRRRQQQAGQWMPEDEKPIFGYNRKPVLMAHELELQDSTNQPRKPVIMTQDSQPYNYANPGFDPGLGPSKGRRRPPPEYRSRPPSRQSAATPQQAGVDEPDDGLNDSPPPDYYVDPALNKPPPAYRLPPPYVGFPGTSEI